MAKRHAVIKNADLDSVVGFALSMHYREPGAVATINGFGVNAAPGIAFIDAIRVCPGHTRSTAKVSIIDNDPELRGLDYWTACDRYPIGQRRGLTPRELELQLASGADDLAGIFQCTGGPTCGC